MKNITLSAKEELIEAARKVAVHQHQTLNDMFREWLASISKTEAPATTVDERLQKLWQQSGGLRVGRKLSRDEMNER